MREGLPVSQDISALDIEDENYLKPVLEDDALLMCLDELPQPSQQGPGPAQPAKGSSTVADSASSLLQRNAELEAELERLSSQFSSYRTTVQQTLDRRWGDADDQSVAAKAVAESKDATSPPNDSPHYFESYAHNGMSCEAFRFTLACA